MANDTSRNGEDSLRERLQFLLDDKEKQLQLAGTLGQRILAQQMELEDRINQLPLAGSPLMGTQEESHQEEIREKLKDLEAIISSWNHENSAFFSGLASQSSSTKLGSPEELDIFRATTSISNQQQSESQQPSAIQSSRRAKNAAHRADDVEFAFEIGSGLLTEVRRLQSLLGERDKAIQDMKEEKDDLDRSISALRNNLNAQERNTDRFKEENWNLEVTLQELRSQVGELQSSNHRLEGEQKRLLKQLTQGRELADKLKVENESLNTSLGDMKAKHETDVAQMRKNAASLQRDKSDLQAALETMKVEVDKRSRTFRTHGPEIGPAKPSLVQYHADDWGEPVVDSTLTVPSPPSGMLTLEPEDEPDQLGLESSLHHAANTDELDHLRRSYLHAQRQIASLKNSLMKEKELRLAQRRTHSVPQEESDARSCTSSGSEHGEESRKMRDHKRASKRRPRLRPSAPANISVSIESIKGESHLVESVTEHDNLHTNDLLPTDQSATTQTGSGNDQFDPAFVSPENAVIRPVSISSGMVQTERVPSDLALELGLASSEAAFNDPSKAGTFGSSARLSLAPLPTSEEITLQSVASQAAPVVHPSHVDAFVATISKSVNDSTCQTDDLLVFHSRDVEIDEVKNAIQLVDAICQTDPLEYADVRAISALDSLPFRFIPPGKQASDKSPFTQTLDSVPSGRSVVSNSDPFQESTEINKISPESTTSVDKTMPPTLALPPPPKAPPPLMKSALPSSSMPPPSRLPDKKSSAPLRPLSPPPKELIQRATTPLSTRVAARSNRQDSIAVVEIGNDYGSERGVQAHDMAISHIRQHSSSASFASDLHSSNPSRRSSLSSNHLNVKRDVGHPGTSFSASLRMQPPGQIPPGATDPNVIHAITQTMIGEFLYKYTRRTIGKGYGEKRHKRYFWVHPYTKTIYWSSSDPSAVGVAESNAKSAFIESVRSVLDPNPLPPGIYQYSVVVSTPQREMKFTAPSKERHDIWITALNFLLSRPTALPHSPEIQRSDRRPIDTASFHGSPSRKGPLISSPQSGRTLASGFSSDTWNITPRAHHVPTTPLSQIGSVRRRPGTPAAEYMRWGTDNSISPGGDFEQIPSHHGDEFEFEIHDDLQGENFDGLENVRTCCDGAHTIGKHHRDDHLHNLEPRQIPNPPHNARPVSPSAWSFRSKANSSRVKH